MTDNIMEISEIYTRLIGEKEMATLTDMDLSWMNPETWTSILERLGSISEESVPR